MDLLLFGLGVVIGGALSFMYVKRVKMNLQQRYEKERNIVQLVESAQDIIYYFQVYPELKQIYTSPSVERFLGEGMLAKLYGKDKTPFEIIHPDDLETMTKKVLGELDYSQPIIQRL